MPQDILNKSHGQTSRARNQDALDTSDGDSPHSHYKTKEEPEEDHDQGRPVRSTLSKTKTSQSSKYSRSSSSSSPNSTKSHKPSSKKSSKDLSVPKKSEEELLARFRTVSSPSNFYLTDGNRESVVTTSLSRIVGNVDEVKQNNGLGYGRERRHTAETKDTSGRSIEVVNTNHVLASGNETLNTAVTTDRSTVTLIKIAKARSQPPYTAPAPKESCPESC
jgi:hypothetical protein